jgi:hypothetical protein
MAGQDRVERYLNASLAFSTCIVMFLVFDHMNAYLQLYAVLSPEATVSLVTGLANNCTKVWQNHREKSARQQTIDKEGISHQWYSDYSSKPKYATSGFCARLPADYSAAHLWNEHLSMILEASSNEDDIAIRLLTSKLLQFLTPSTYLELGHRAQPSTVAWGRLLEKLEARLNSDTAPLVHIAAFGGNFDCDWTQAGNYPSEEAKLGCLWPIRLEAFINNMLNMGKDDADKRAIVNVSPVSNPQVPVTTEFDTAVVQHGLWNENLIKHGGPDVIISAFTSHDMYLPRRQWKTAEDIDFYHHQRRVIQDFIRACLEMQPCSKSGVTNSPPVVISLDDYVGNQHGPVLADTTQARVLQVLSDYYETAFVSYSEVIRKLVYASRDASSPLIHRSPKEWTITNMANTMKNEKTELIEHAFVGPVAMTLTMVFSFLRYTVSFCSDQATKNEKVNSLMSQEVIRRSEEIIPPKLNTDLRLQTITTLWKEEETRQTQRIEQCKASAKQESSSCPFAFLGGARSMSQDLDQYLAPFVQGDMLGWEARLGGYLVATKSGATLKLRFPSMSKDANWSIQIFSSFKDSSSVPFARLQWEISVHGKRRAQRRNLEQHGNTTASTPRRYLQKQTGLSISTGIINGTHDSPHTVALPTTILVNKSLVSSDIALELQLIEGDEFEIVGILFCGEML